MKKPKVTDPTVEEIAAFVQYVSRLTLSDRLQTRFAGAADVVSRAELQIIRAVGRAGRLTYRQLAQRLGLDPTTVSRQAAGLVERGLVVREVDAVDKRKAWLELTPAAQEALHAVEEVYLEYYEVAISDWTERQRNDARRTLALLQDSLARLQIDETGRATGLAPRRAKRSA